MKIIERENENYIETLVPKKNLLLDLINDESLRKQYFSKIDVSQFTYDNYKKLLKEFSKLNQKTTKKKKSLLYEIYKKYFIEDILDEDEMSLMLISSKINDFDKNLSYILYFNIISLEDAKSRGFKDNYLNNLLIDCISIVNDPYDHHYKYFDTENSKVKTHIK